MSLRIICPIKSRLYKKSGAGLGRPDKQVIKGPFHKVYCNLRKESNSALHYRMLIFRGASGAVPLTVHHTLIDRAKAKVMFLKNLCEKALLKE
jgi:hypothetical protein